MPAMSTPASRKLLKSCPNLLVALARSWVVPLDAWTTSLADWFRPAATSLSWAWTSWKLLPLDGNCRRRRRRANNKNCTSKKSSIYFSNVTRVFDLLTESARRVLLASPTVRMALSTSLWPGREFTHLLRAWETALATYTHTQVFHF